MAERRRGWSGWIVGIVILLALAWVGYWYAARYAADAAIARAAARGIGCGEVALSGFPFQLDVRCARGAYAANGSTAGLGGFLARAPLYAPGAINARLESPLMVNLPERNIALTATWTTGSANAGAWLDGINSAGAAFTTLRIENSGNLPVASLAADSASGALTPAPSGSYDLATSLHRLSLTRSNGAPYPTLDLDAAATAEGVGALGTDPSQAFLTWLRGAPKLDIKRLRIAAKEAIIAASGDLSLSRDGLLNGTLLIRYNSPEALRGLILELRPETDPDKLDAALSGLRSMSKAIDSEDGPAFQTSVSFIEGKPLLVVLPLEMFGVPSVPPIRF
jgi:hypothetical protein